MEKRTKRYTEVASLFRAHARHEGADVVPDPATADEVAAAERALECRLPDSYRWFQLEFGDFEQGHPDVFTVRPAERSMGNIVAINEEARENAHPRLPPHLIAFSDSGGGDYLCFDSAAFAGGECPVVWWDHELDETQAPAPAGASFLDWLEQEIRDRESDPKGSLFDSMLPIYADWIRDALERERGK